MAKSSTAERETHARIIGGRYRVERLLGKGGVGTVYAATDQTRGSIVALKQLSSDASATSAALFEREYRTLASLHHPSIIEVYDYGTDGDGPYYTMELLEGSDLSRQAPMSWREACACLRDIASVLGVLHARRFVHRDLSPTNLWRLRSGRLKLIDFGSVAPFGAPLEIVGTPQFIAPEVLEGASLDQRVDLFALGALGYWLITGVHAFPAQRLEELRRLWARVPKQPSEVLRLAEPRSDESIPADLDALLSALLRVDRDERLNSTAALIDRLTAIAGLASEPEDVATRGYLESKAFVGRTGELEQMSQLLRGAQEGVGHTLLVKGSPGSGRTRLLAELKVVAQLASAVTLTLDGSDAARTHGVLEAVSHQLIGSLRDVARAAAEPYRALLAQLSPELARKLGAEPPTQVARAPKEFRLVLHTALRDWLLEIARTHTLALFVDDLHALDEESQAFIAGLAHAAKSRKLLVVATLGRSADAQAPAIRSLRAISARLVLEPLTTSETLELLHSVFGRVPYLERLAERLHRVSEGSPAHTLELAQHLVSSGVIRYADGLWTLPADIAEAQLPRSREQGLSERLDHLSVSARELARTLSVAQGSLLGRETCFAMGDGPRMQTERALEQLLLEGVLVEEAQGLRFAHESLQARLAADLDEAALRDAHARFARAALANARGDQLTLLRASLHLLRANDVRGGLRALRQVVGRLSEGDASQVASSATVLEECVLLLRERRVSEYALVAPMAALACCGYLVHPRYAREHGDGAMALLERILQVKLMRRLAPRLGKKLALSTALTLAALILVFRRGAPPLREIVRWLFTTASALAASSAVSIDPDRTARHAEALEPFTALGPDHAATFLHGYCQMLALQGRERQSAAELAQRSVIARLESSEPIVGLPDALRSHYLAGAYFSLGVNETRRDAGEVLSIADKLEAFGPLYAMSADYLRASHYAHRGESANAERYRQLLELHAIQLGSVWQVETWAPSDATKVALRTNDAVMMRRAVEELARLAAENPSLRLHEQHARGAYLVLRGKYREAIALLETKEEPLAIVGYCRTRGLLARAYRALGKPERAYAICKDALARVPHDDLAFPVANLNLQIEYALADAALGRTAEAKRRLELLIAAHDRNKGPLTLGALHEARANVALTEGDLDGCERHILAMERWVRPTGIATLHELVDSLRRRLELARQKLEPSEESLRLDDSQLVDRVKLLLDKATGSYEERAQKVLQIALMVARAEQGLIMVPPAGGQSIAHVGPRARESALLAWARRRLSDTCLDESTQLDLAPPRAMLEDVYRAGRTTFVFVPLFGAHADGVVAALVLGAEKQRPRVPSALVLMAMASKLDER